MTIRTMTHDDIRFALGLTDALGWGFTAAEYQHLLAYDPDGCFVAEDDRVSIGTVTSTSYGRLGWIGNLIVLPEYRGRGIGRQLMEQAMGSLRRKGAQEIKLDAEPRAVSLYKRLGFQEECHSLRFSGIGKVVSHSDITDMKEIHLNEISHLDQDAIGADRGKVLSALFHSFPQLCAVAARSGALVGFIMGRERKEGFQIGPWVCLPRCVQEAEALLQWMLGRLEGKKIRVGVQETNGASVFMLKRNGFHEIDFSIRMNCGTTPGQPSSGAEFALGGPEKG